MHVPTQHTHGLWCNYCRMIISIPGYKLVRACWEVVFLLNTLSNNVKSNEQKIIQPTQHAFDGPEGSHEPAINVNSVQYHPLTSSGFVC